MSDTPPASHETALDIAPDLAKVVSEECMRLNLSTVTAPPAVSVTTSEAQRISNYLPFPTDLKFTVEVNMAASKIAFQNLISDFDDTNFLGLWKDQRGHDPFDMTHPIGEVSLTHMMVQPEKDS